MGNTTNILLVDGATEVALSPERHDAIKNAILSSRAIRTHQEYKRQFAAFATWCAAHDRNPVPCNHETLAGYVTALRDGTATGRQLAAKSIEVAISSVIAANRLAGHQIDRKSGKRKSLARLARSRPNT
jgi:hypothetical protein